ncbi:alpha/beta hydrolase [Aspergillus aculeatinus CBS 121060]|uniref:Alpha/beta-hydrolase n=1 Tax=Aspergillus aculeatinus CBS 121060 TaxID=1448322 RepID=A0ACD1H8F0_9EURO|nr:alpha/beta-hydrolase [Aspergillus aculeatinus CBS 121060]RAH69780.1 alpha/beta-hydrolase [Aspergillus aculeatinus CBS 121060]
MPPNPIPTTFLSRNNLHLAAHLYPPCRNAPSRAGAAIIIAHPWTSIKEQSPANYARYLSAAGFTCLTYDAAHHGESPGQPRRLEDPFQRVEEIKNAATHLATNLSDSVDPHRIGVLGICAAGGYAAFAAQTDLRLRAVATVSAACVGELVRRGGPLSQDTVDPEILQTQLALAAKDRTAMDLPTRREGDEDVGLVRMLPQRYEDLPADAPPAMRDFAAYYCTPRGYHPRADGVARAQSWDLMANFEAFRFMDRVSPRPVLMVVGERAESRWVSEAAVERAREPKEVFVVEGRSHADSYDRVEEDGHSVVSFYGREVEEGLCT